MEKHPHKKKPHYKARKTPVQVAVVFLVGRYENAAPLS
jgi:hypothetical protein